MLLLSNSSKSSKGDTALWTAHLECPDTEEKGCDSMERIFPERI